MTNPLYDQNPGNHPKQHGMRLNNANDEEAAKALGQAPGIPTGMGPASRTPAPQPADSGETLWLESLNLTTDQYTKVMAWHNAAVKKHYVPKTEVAAAVQAAQVELLDFLEQDLKRLDGRNWTLETLALDTLVASGKADEYQKSKRQEIVEDRRAAHALYVILANARKKFALLDGERRKGGGKNNE